MTKALSFFECDVDYCSLTYGLAPCNALRAGDYTATGINHRFQGSVGNGWLSVGGALTTGPSYMTFNQNGADPQMFVNGISVNGAVERYVVVDVERQSGAGTTFDGTIFYGTSGHTFSASFHKRFTLDQVNALEVVGSRVQLVFDMSALTAGGNDWITNTITDLRFDFNAGSDGGILRVYSVRIGHIATADEATGADKCLNTRATCQDIANFTDVGATMRFAVNTEYLPRDIDCIPNIKQRRFTPAIISLGENLGQRATLDVEFFDHPHPDTGVGGDKYYAERAFNPFEQGTFWPKFRARHPYLQGRDCRMIIGNTAHTLASMDTRHYVVDTTQGPDRDGKFKIVAKDILKLADGTKSQAPRVSNGTLNAALTIGGTLLSLKPAGVGAEYGSSGHINIGGSEIVAFTRLPDATLLIHADGADASTTFTDAAKLKPVIRGGNAQVDTAQSKFGGASAEFDGVDDSIVVNTTADPDFAFGTGPYSIDFWFRPRVTPANYQLFDFRFNLTDVAPSLTMDGGNTLTFAVGGVAKITSGVVITGSPTVRWYHVALCKDAVGHTRLFVDGVQTGSTYTTNDNLIIGNATRPVFGLRSDSALDFSGWIDEIRITKGRADFTANFTPPTSAYGAVLGDNAQITRAQLGTEAATHEQDERAQLVLTYSGDDPATIIADLFENYAGVPASYIPLSSWLFEVNAYLGNAYSAHIAEPTSVDDLISELVLQAALAIWWDDSARLIRLQVLRAIPASAQRITGDTMLLGSLQVTEQPEKRISRVLTYFGLINPLRGIDELENYASQLLTIDTASEANYQSVALKKIFSRWIPFGGEAIAQRLNDVQIARYSTAPRLIRFQLMRFDEQLPSLGGGYNVAAQCFQDALGAAVDIPTQCIRLNADDAIVDVEVEEMRFTGEPIDPNVHTITIDTDVFNVNLRTLHDSLYGEPLLGNVVNLIVQEGAIIGSNDVNVFSLIVGDWPAGSPAITINIKGVGRIQGKGGDGGYIQPGLGGANVPPQKGSGALYTRRAISIDMAGGQIWGGGGGGGGSGNTAVPEFQGGAGGGGQGQTPGNGGAQGTSYPWVGSSGNTEAPGDGFPGGGNVFAGGDGGASGQNGQNGIGGVPHTGGLGGAAIDGVSFVTMVNAPDIDGSQIN